MAIAAVVCVSARHACGQSFTGLGLTPGAYQTIGSAVSADGAVAVGGSRDVNGPYGDHAFRWTNGSGAQNLAVPGGSTNAYGYGVSSDGSAIAGSCASQAFRWTAASGMVSLGAIDGSQSEGNAISGDASVVVGSSSLNLGWQAFRWTANGGMVSLGLLPTGTSSDAYATSYDGSVVVGDGSEYNGHLTDYAFRWTTAQGMVSLGLLPGSISSSARGVSPDGSTVVGASGHAFLWTVANGMQDLGVLPGRQGSGADGVSADGKAVVGNSDGIAFLWTPGQGMVDLNALLPTLGVDLTGWTLANASAITPDGRTIVGFGHHNGHTEGWIATIPSPAAPMLLAMSGLLAASRRRRLVGGATRTWTADATEPR
jgi:probable HAF family extracellular repeat protein